MVPLRPVTHPDMWDYVTHLTGRPRQSPSVEGTPQERLEGILRDRRIRASQPYWEPMPVVCFTESTAAGLTHLLGAGQFQPWGITFRKDFAYAQGAGPVHYLRDEEWSELDAVPMFRSRAVRLSPGESEWLHEREWRSVHPVGDGLRFEAEDVVAVIVGEASWPDPEVVPVAHPMTGDMDWGIEYPAWARDIRKWWWDPAGRQFLELAL